VLSNLGEQLDDHVCKLEVGFSVARLLNEVRLFLLLLVLAVGRPDGVVLAISLVDLDLLECQKAVEQQTVDVVDEQIAEGVEVARMRLR